MHEKAKQRIKEKKEKQEENYIVFKPKTKDVFNEFFYSVLQECDNLLKAEITDDEKIKTLRIRSFIEINLKNDL